MQPVEEQKGVYTKSPLFDSLKVYLNNKNRLQPIIGLSSIIECVNTGTHNREALYLCEVCVCRLSKADIRNHIMGSLHRYNYIKAWHPHLLSEWKENSDLSKLAWPLMDKAKILEEKEGPGDVWLLEVEDALYQKMAALSENDGATLINILRAGQGESESHSETTSVQLEHCPVQSNRIVLLGQNQLRQSKNSVKTSAKTNKPPSVIYSTVASSVKSEDWLNDASTSLSVNTQTSPEPSVISEISNSCLDGYTGTVPLIGLFHVVECRSEEGNTYCFLCHCCRIRSNKKDIIDHLTSSSHILNYLMETHPELVEVMMEHINDNYELQSLAKKVEEEEGRGELKVVNAPESLCVLLTGKSYHWCIKMLCNGWTHKNIQKRKIAVKGASVNKTSNQGTPEMCAKALSECPERMTKKKMGKQSNTVFKVSLPITKGSVLLERTSFSFDTLLDTSYLPQSDSDLIPLQESQSEDSELNCDTGSEYTSQLQQDLYSGDTDAGEYMEPESHFVSHQQGVDRYSSNNEYLNQSEYMTGTKDQKLYGEMNYNRHNSSQESSSERIYKGWQNQGPQTQNEWLSPAVSHTQDLSSYNYSYGCVEGCTEQWYYSALQSNVSTRVEVSRGLGATEYDYEQQPKGQYTAHHHAGPLTGGVGQPASSGEVAPHLDAAWVNIHPHLGDSLAHSGSIAPEQSGQFLDTEQRRWQTYMECTPGHFQTAPQSYMTQPIAHQAIQVVHGVMSNPNYNIAPMTNPDQHFPHSTVIWNPR